MMKVCKLSALLVVVALSGCMEKNTDREMMQDLYYRDMQSLYSEQMRDYQSIDPAIRNGQLERSQRDILNSNTSGIQYRP